MTDGDWGVPGESLTLPFGSVPPGPGVILSGSTADLPADLIAYYAGFGEVVIAAFVFFTSGVAYEYQAFITNSFGNFAFMAFGGKDSFGDPIHENYRLSSPGAVPLMDLGAHEFGVAQIRLLNGSAILVRTSSVIQVVDDGSVLVADTGRIEFVASGTLFNMGSGLFQIASTAAFTIDGVSAGRGLKMFVGVPGNSAAIGAEAVVLTGGAQTFVDGRCYAITWSHNVNGTVAAPGTFAFVRFRKTNLAGTLLGFAQVHLPAAGAQNYGQGTIHVRRATGAGDLVDNLVMTLQAVAGTVTQTGAATDLRNFKVEDCGDEGDYPNAIAI